MKIRRSLIGWSIGLLAGFLFVLILGYRAWNDRDQTWVFASEVDPLASPTAPILCKNGNLLKGTINHPLYALDSVSGRVRWKFVCPLPGESSSTHPVTDSDGTVYIGSASKFYALDGATGKERWSLNLGSITPVVGDNHQVFVGAKQLLALDSRTGKQQWAFPSSAPQKSRVSIAPDAYLEKAAYGNGMVLVAIGDPANLLVALDAATGQPRWQVAQKEGSTYDAWLALAVTENHTVIVGQGSKSLCALDSATGQLRWTFQSGYDPKLLCSQGMIYVTDGEGHISALSEANGAVKWRQHVDQEITTAPALDDRGTLYIGAHRNSLYALDATTGQFQWRHGMGNIGLHSALFAELFGEDYVAVTTGPNGMVYAASTDGHLHAFRRP